MPLSDEARDWRDACRRAVVRQRQLLAASRSATERSAKTSVGASGDITLAIDRDFEAIALEELDTLVQASRAATFIVSEERGEILPTSGTAMTWIVLDPIDGSTNIANGLPQFSLSVAVASGPSMADVWFGFVFDFGSNEEFVCEKGRGVEVDCHRMCEPSLGPTRIVGCESAEPRLLAAGVSRLADAGVAEIRVIGSIAIALCYVALGRFDGLLTCRQCRSVDAAAGQLIASSMGAHILFDGEPQETAGLRLSERYRLVAGRGTDVQTLLQAQRLIPLAPR
jgi:myo-inositol-1(or 4)-monophosphatase